MKTYHIEINRNHVTNVEAVSEIAALKIFIEGLSDLFHLIGDTERIPVHVYAGYEDGKHFFLKPKRVEFMVTECEEHFYHVAGTETVMGEVLGEAVPCQQCKSENSFCSVCNGTGQVSNKNIRKANQELTEFIKSDASTYKARL